MSIAFRGTSPTISDPTTARLRDCKGRECGERCVCVRCGGRCEGVILECGSFAKVTSGFVLSYPSIFAALLECHMERCGLKVGEVH